MTETKKYVLIDNHNQIVGEISKEVCDWLEEYIGNNYIGRFKVREEENFLTETNENKPKKYFIEKEYKGLKYEVSKEVYDILKEKFDSYFSFYEE